MKPKIYTFDHRFVQKTKFFDSHGNKTTPEFDFIVVGGGPSGCALATKLYETGRGKFSVLLVERGPQSSQNPQLHNCVQIPLQARTLHESSFDYSYETAQEGDQFITKDVIANSGKVLGGSTNINFCIWSLGSKEDYDLLAQETGNNFAWSNVQPAFDKITKHVITTRPIPRSRNPTWSGIAESSLFNAGFEKIEDTNAGNILGYGKIQETVDNHGLRVSATRYFDSASSRHDCSCSIVAEHMSPFEVWTRLTVEKVEFEVTVPVRDQDVGSEPRATGIQTAFGLIRARKEVILTAGAIASPYLLLLSGIGSATALQQAGITTVCHSPDVGQGLWEHPYVDVPVKLRVSDGPHETRKSGRDTVEDLSSLGTSIRHLKNWTFEGHGLMSGLPLEWIAYSNYKKEILANHRDHESLSPLERNVFFRDSCPHVEHFLHYGHGLTPALFTFPPAAYINITNVLLTPRSRGSVSLNSSYSQTAKPVANLPSHRELAPPKILLNTMNDPLDLHLMVKALKKSYDILLGPVWADYVDEKEAHTLREKLSDDNMLLQMIQENTSTLWHFGGTCSMTTRHSKGVVDNRFRVLGVTGLRVADTSVLPFPVTAHTQSIAYLLGEQAAETILSDYSGCTSAGGEV